MIQSPTPKFKALYRDKWYIVEELCFFPDGGYSVGKFMNENFSPDLEHVKAIVQYIGVNDRDDKKIYFGDILEVQGNRSGANTSQQLFGMELDSDLN